MHVCQRPCQCTCHNEPSADACGFGKGAARLQEGGPTVFLSKELHAAERNCGVREQDLLAAVHAMKMHSCAISGDLSTQQQAQTKLYARDHCMPVALLKCLLGWLGMDHPSNSWDTLAMQGLKLRGLQTPQQVVSKTVLF